MVVIVVVVVVVIVIAMIMMILQFDLKSAAQIDRRTGHDDGAMRNGRMQLRCSKPQSELLLPALQEFFLGQEYIGRGPSTWSALRGRVRPEPEQSPPRFGRPDKAEGAEQNEEDEEETCNEKVHEEDKKEGAEGDEEMMRSLIAVPTA